MTRPTLSCVCLALLPLWLACGSVSPRDPVDDDPFDPGGRPGGGGYGSGSGMSDGPPMCSESQRRCEHEFSYPGKGDEQSVELRGDFRPDGWSRGEPMKWEGGAWRVRVPVPWQAKVLYKFRILDKDGKEVWLPDPNNPEGEPDGFGGQNSVLRGVTCARWTCAPPVPMCAGPTAGTFDWRDAVLYFVFVDRFLDGNPGNNAPVSAPGLKAAANWQGGDWAGVTRKIREGYFQALGVNTLWLSVPMDNTDATGIGDDGELYTAYHGYWPRDLNKTERRFGTEAELRTLVDEAHRAGMKVLVDYAMNHVHKDSPIYQMHRADGWFNPLQQMGQDCICGQGICGWDGPYSKTCWFRDYLPDFNFANADARRFSVGNAVEWLQRIGLDGYRLDAVKHIELSWLLDLRARLTAEVEPRTNQHVYLVGETFSGNRDLLRSFVDPCRMLDGQFDFPLRAEVVSKLLMRQGRMQDLVAFVQSNKDFYGSGVMSTFLGNHDVPRVIHFAQDRPLWDSAWAGGRERSWMNQPARVSEQSAYERVALGMTLLMTIRGVPLIYYGDEIGLPGAGDPDNRRFMQWSNYSAGQQWLLERMKKLGALRAQHAVFRRGDLKTLSQTDDTWAYEMAEGAARAYVVLNRSDTERTVGGLPAAMLRDELSGERLTGPEVRVPPRGARVLLP
ncbi:MAG: alpha-amylase family glycosyl hydrolase [Myxococcales bacterium]|nr:alpha-amylase family glycosyl hydrolase [Myxococcota bacterium]MDW8282389.1 alpha-amylase family glycosyl hydrolase [Myxococcales bacterium]